MITPADIQTYLERSAAKQYQCERIPGFTLCFHPVTDLPFFNYAIPENVVPSAWESSITEMRDLFLKRKRVPRLEFVLESSPALPRILTETGFRLEEEQQGMVCFPHTFFAPSTPEEISFSDILRTSRDEEIRQFLLLQEEGFTSLSPEPKSSEEISYFRHILGTGKGCICFWKNLPASVGMHTSPLEGITEILGVTTLKEHRRRGIASALISRIVETCFSKGIHTCYLTAANRDTQYIYGKLGFSPFLTMLSYTLRQS